MPYYMKVLEAKQECIHSNNCTFKDPELKIS